MASAPSTRLHALTSLRFFAALWVICYHQSNNWLARVSELSPAPVHNLLRIGYVSVSFFFVLSGFVLAHSQHTHDGQYRPATHAHFWWARVTRIAPLYWLGIVLVAPFVFRIARATQGQGAGRFIASSLTSALFMLQSWVPDYASVWNPPGWSISTEAFFYLSFPFLAPLVLKLRGKAVFAFLAVAVVAAAAAPTVAFAMDIPRFGRLPATLSPEPASGPWVKGIAFGPVFRLPEFLFGVGLYRVHLQVRGRLPTLRVALGVTSIALVALALIAPRVPYPYLHNGLLAPIWGGLILCAAVGDDRGVLSSRPLVVLGEASYAMYILHFPVAAWMRALSRPVEHLVARAPEATMLLYLLVVTGCSVGAFLYVENPLRRRLRRALPR